MWMIWCFFFSSRRRHTSCYRDWSSDVCSSDLEDFQGLAVLFKRVKNIAKELPAGTASDRTALTEPAERALVEELDARRPRIEAAAARSDYRAAFMDIAGLRAAVDRFFTEVFVMADDVRVRNARLTLMADLRDLILHLADISEIIPQTE